MESAIVLTQTRVFQYLQWKYAMRLEAIGLKNSRGSVTAHVKKAMGFKGNREKVMKQLDDFIAKNYPSS